MNLKILLPFRVFADIIDDRSIVIETSEGFYGLLPQRLDCVAALVPGIFSYEAATGGPRYLAIAEGILVKAGPRVLVSVRNAIGGADLGQLGELVKTTLKHADETESAVRSVTTKLESAFLYRFNMFRKN
jgi:F-type H+-transporting ATPase subunit epsilon